MRTGRGSTPEIEAERRRKISESHIGMKHSEESKQKVSQNKKGKPLSEEHKQLLSQIRRGRPKSEEHKRKISESLKGHEVSEESRRKLSEKLSGENHPMFGKKVPPDLVKRRADAQRGRVFSDDHRKKMSIAGKRRVKELNNAWIDGRSFEPYCELFDDFFKERCRAFFGRICLLCESGEIKRKHDVHHVYAEKKACCEGSLNLKEMDKLRMVLPTTVARVGEPTFSDEELLYIRMVVPLCRGCHSKVGSKKMEAAYRKIISDIVMTKYNGKCYYSKEEYTQLFPEAQ